jgi:hypothetical protein
MVVIRYRTTFFEISATVSLPLLTNFHSNPANLGQDQTVFLLLEIDLRRDQADLGQDQTVFSHC